MPDNIDLNRIREVYASMPDEEIIQFTQQEGLHITVDAFLLLRAELHKRNIGLEALKALEHEMILQDVLIRKRIAEDWETNDDNETGEFSFTPIEQDTRHEDIHAGHVVLNVQPEETNQVVNKQDNWAEMLRKDAVNEMQAGLVLFIVGVIVLFIAFRIEHFYFAAGIVPLLGIARIVKGAVQKRSAEKILETMKTDEEKLQARN